MNTLLPIINDMVVIFFDLLIFTRMVTLKRNTALSKVFMYGGCAVIIVFYFIATYLLGWAVSISSAVCMSIPSLLLFFALSTYKDCRFFITFCLVDTVSLIIAFIGRYVGRIVGQTGAMVSLVVTVGIFLAIVIIGNPYFKRYAKLLEAVKSGWGNMMAAMVLIYIALIVFAAYPRPLVERWAEGAPVYLLFCAVVLTCYAVFISSIFKTKKIYEQYKEIEKEKKYHKLAYTDPLTGLYNRAAYMERINELERETAGPATVCCIVFDMDDFKHINDENGHRAGDIVLKHTAEILKEVLEEYAYYLFRMGGDEFFVAAADAQEDKIKEQLKEIAAQIEEQVKKGGIPFSASAGYAFWKRGGEESLEDTFFRADREMYAQKGKRRERA